MCDADQAGAPARFSVHRGILSELGRTLAEGADVLDFGCGAGAMVAEYRRRGYRAVGCDVVLERPEPHLFPIAASPYRLPFDDASFDFVFSDQVMEHVRDHERAFSEVLRVLRPGAPSLHIFPSRWKPLEDHVYVPFAGAFRPRWWLLLWARLGVRNEFQHDKGWHEVAEANARYLAKETSYLSTAELCRLLSHFDAEVVFAERHLIKHTSGRARRLHPLVGLFPVLAAVYRTFYSCAVLLVKR